MVTKRILKNISLSLISVLYITSTCSAQSVSFTINAPATLDDYGKLISIPDSFGIGEFTFQIWILPDTSYPVGPTGSGTNQITNWSNADPVPYGNYGWWFPGNFLLDGHNNGSFDQGTFSLQFYGGGRVRWHFGDGFSPGLGDPWVIQAYPASSTNSLLDGNWHLITCVRRWEGVSNAILELWVDDTMVESDTSPVRSDMRGYWDQWSGWPQAGFFIGAEKQAAEDCNISQYEDFKGLLDEMRFYNHAKSTAIIMQDFNSGIGSWSKSLKGLYTFKQGGGDFCINDVIGVDTIFFFNLNDSIWDVNEHSATCAPLAGTFTVDHDNATSPDFGSILQAMVSLKQCTMNDTVVLDLINQSTPYEEFIDWYPIPGNNDLTPILIDGNGATIHAIGPHVMDIHKSLSVQFDHIILQVKP